MMLVGILLVLVGLGGAGFGFWQWRKLKMIGGAPLAKSGQIVGNASDAGLVAVEGNIQTPEPLIAPCSGKPCLYYELSIGHKYEKYTGSGENRRKTKGKNSVTNDKVGARFLIDDGSGPAKVDATEGKVSGKLEKVFDGDGLRRGAIAYSGEVTFGEHTAVLPNYSGEGWATGSYAVEKIIPADGSAYVAGRLEGDTIMKKKNVGGRLVIAREGLEALEKSTKTKAMAGGIGGLVMLIAGAGMAATADSPTAPDVLSLAPGFTPTPTTISGLSGGLTEASSFAGDDCRGTTTQNPDAIVTVTADIPMLRIMAKSNEDTTLIVQTPTGQFLCNDDTDGYNPAVDGPAPAGEYKVWVGSYDSENNGTYTLGFTEDVTVLPSSL